MSLEARHAEIMRRIDASYGPIIAEAFVAVVCDGCGKLVQAPTLEEIAPLVEGWYFSPLHGDDYCEECRR